ncbi:MAG: SMP-30/gluconolactonase/LRE family protein, partial [Burkholderiaceae bacterium]
MQPTITLLSAAPNLLGESPFWHPHEQCLYWIDIDGCSVQRFNPATQQAKYWTLPCEPGACAPVARGGAATHELILALRDGFYLLDTRSDSLTKVLAAPSDTSKFRFNDGKCDAAGRLWVGAMYEPRDQELGALWCLTYAHGQFAVEQKAQGNVTTNGLAFSPDNRLLYWAHTRAHRIDCFDFDLAQGRITGRRVFKQFELKQDNTPYGGRPDGAAVDAHGNYWCAMYEGGAVVKLSPAGEGLQRIVLPASKPTMPCFGGADGKTLYITTAKSDEAAGG